MARGTAKDDPATASDEASQSHASVSGLRQHASELASSVERFKLDDGLPASAAA